MTLTPRLLYRKRKGFKYGFGRSWVGSRTAWTLCRRHEYLALAWDQTSVVQHVAQSLITVAGVIICLFYFGYLVAFLLLRLSCTIVLPMFRE